MDRIEIAFKCVEILISLIGLVLVLFGLILPYKTSIKGEIMHAHNELKLERIRWEKELIDAQISNLYGPIYALIIEDNIRSTRVLYQLNRQYVIPKDMSFSDLPDEEQKIWKHYVDTYKIPDHSKIAEIMRTNIHLFYKSEIPTCYKVFLDYSLGWELLDNQKRNGVPNYYDYHYVFNYPTEFIHYIRTTLSHLLDIQTSLIKQSESKLDSSYMSIL